MIKAKASFVHSSPRKLRLVADSVRGLSVGRAMDMLKSLPNRATGPLLKVFQQAVGNAKTNFKKSLEELSVASIFIDEGPRMKRRDGHAHGARFDSGIRRKRMAHITVELKGDK